VLKDGAERLDLLSFIVSPYNLRANSERAAMTKPLLGAHQSIAGGFHQAVERAAAAGCDVLQIFTKNTNQWRARPITADEAQRFLAALAESGIACPVAHDSYLVNLASPDAALWKKSIDAMVEELLRAAALGIPWLVAHPGAYTTGNEAEGLRRIVVALDEVLDQTRDRPVGCLLETTAGQGTALGWRFEHLAEFLGGVKSPERLGVCFDTCHVFAAGYGLSTPAEYRSTMRQFDQTIGLKQIRAFHLNDSVKDRGSRVDRHAHIGRGRIGRDAFRLLLRDRRFHGVPMILETPKGSDGGTDWDVINLSELRALVQES
jgi:deoxyribonuclease-4